MLQQDPALLGPSGPRLAPAREARRTVLLAARDATELDGLVVVGRCLAPLNRHELLLTQAVESEGSLADAVAATRARRDGLVSRRHHRSRGGVRLPRVRSTWRASH